MEEWSKKRVRNKREKRNKIRGRDKKERKKE